MALMLFTGAWGKMIDEKKPEAKNIVTLSLLKDHDFTHRNWHVLFPTKLCYRAVYLGLFN
jgi:hypothetical protein